MGSYIILLTSTVKNLFILIILLTFYCHRHMKILTFELGLTYKSDHTITHITYYTFCKLFCIRNSEEEAKTQNKVDSFS